MYQHRLIGGALALLLIACQPPTIEVSDQPAVVSDEQLVTVLVLGTYHFANPGQDLNNIEAEDVLSAKRQAELEVLAEVIAEFEPTAIALERVSAPPYTDPMWPEFSPGVLLEERDERVQLGYRIARDTGIDRIYAIDEQPSDNEPDYFPFGQVQSHAEQTGQTEYLTQITDMSELLAEFETAQSTASIPELLMMVNSPDFGESLYWNIIRVGKGEDQPGAELAAYWFMRNAKIFNKLDQVAEPGDRILVVYGAGHASWLNEITQRTSGYRLEPLTPYLERAAERLTSAYD